MGHQRRRLGARRRATADFGRRAAAATLRAVPARGARRRWCRSLGTDARLSGASPGGREGGGAQLPPGSRRCQRPCGTPGGAARMRTPCAGCAIQRAAQSTATPAAPRSGHDHGQHHSSASTPGAYGSASHPTHAVQRRAIITARVLGSMARTSPPWPMLRLRCATAMPARASTCFCQTGFPPGPPPARPCGCGCRRRG